MILFDIDQSFVDKRGTSLSLKVHTNCLNLIVYLAKGSTNVFRCKNILQKSKCNCQEPRYNLIHYC